jgi:hypothetical protein
MKICILVKNNIRVFAAKKFYKSVEFVGKYLNLRQFSIF